MGCLSANAKLIRETISADSSLMKDDVDISTEIERDPLIADASIKRDEIDIDVSIVCTIGEDNSLWASDGVLYNGNSQPLFTTEKWES